MTDNTPLTPEALAQAVAAIRERVEALPDEPTFLKWNYNLYGMIRGVYTECAIANVFEKPYDVFYQEAPADIGLLLQALAVAEARAGQLDEALLVTAKGLRAIAEHGGDTIEIALDALYEMACVLEGKQQNLDANVQLGTSAALADGNGNGEAAEQPLKLADLQRMRNIIDPDESKAP